MKKLLNSYYAISGIHYILGVEDKHTSEELIEAVKKIAPHKEQDIMTAAQQLRQEGRQEGMQEEKLHIAKHMLASNEPKEKVHQFTGLSWVEIEALVREQETVKKQH